MKLGERVKNFIESKGLNYRTLSVLIPYSDVQIRRICLNESKPKVDFFQHLCNVFPKEIDLDWMLNGIKKEKLPMPNEKDILDTEILSKIIYDNWEELLKDRLFKSNFESKAATWAIKIKKEADL
ncbi:helix-turn-helix domain-containing protein [Tenacibaculum dicentrarchi]|nr:helix-turn-helix domain-containing protein [Tenacibaculum dicentrarchi]